MTDSFHTWKEAETYCLSFISPEGAKERTLKRMVTLMHLLGNPQKNLHVIHVAGSYGKSSTAYMIASLLEQKGLTVGLHIKPHLQSMTERMCINRVPIANDVFLSYVNKIRPVIELMKEPPTYFELLVAVMLLYFSETHVDVAVVEAGRGGRLDATNICNSDMLVLTNVFSVHTDILGETKKEIVQEKMGLARMHTKIVAGVTQKPLQTYMQLLAKPLAATVQFSGTDGVKNISIPLKGTMQRKNAALALLAATTYTTLSEKQITAAFASMKLPGRFEVHHIGTNTVIFDSAHNEEKMRFLLHDVQKEYPKQNMTIILRNENPAELKAFINILTPITKNILRADLEHTKTKRALSVSEVIEYFYKQTDTMFLVTGSMKLIGSIRAGLSLPYTLK